MVGSLFRKLVPVFPAIRDCGAVHRYCVALTVNVALFLFFYSLVPTPFV